MQLYSTKPCSRFVKSFAVNVDIVFNIACNTGPGMNCITNSLCYGVTNAGNELNIQYYKCTKLYF